MDKLSYALGMEIAQNLKKAGVESLEYKDFVAGVTAIFENTEKAMTVEEGEKLMGEFFAKKQKEEEMRIQLQAAIAQKEGEEFLRANKTKEGVKVTMTGLQYKVVTEGEGENPTSHDRVKCHYEGRFVSGELFDSSYKRGEPAVFGVDQVIPGWVEALQLMKPGAKYELYIPGDLAYGPRGIPGRIPGNSVLIFTVELLEIL